MQVQTPTYQSTGHLLLTGPIRGTVTLEDGSVVDVSAPVIELPTTEAVAEVAHAIGEHWAEVGHPDDTEVDEDTGELVQRDFVYDDSHYQDATAATDDTTSTSSSTTKKG